LDLGIFFVIFVDWGLGFFRLWFFICFVFMDGSVGVLSDWGLSNFIFHFVHGFVVLQKTLEEQVLPVNHSSEDEVGGVGSGDEFSDIEWHSNEFFTATDSDEEDNDKESYGSFPTFSMPKSMEQYKWEVGTYFTEKKEFTNAI